MSSEKRDDLQPLAPNGKKPENDGPKKVGNQLKHIDWEVVKNLLNHQCTQAEIASILNMNPKTLGSRVQRDFGMSWKDFSDLHTGEMKHSLRRAQFELAVEKKNPVMLIWLGKQYLGQLDKPEPKQQDTKINIIYSDAKKGKKEDE